MTAYSLKEVSVASIRKKVDCRRRTGFTLVEVALAVVVVAIGVTAAFALIAAGLAASKKAVAETRASIFADNVFNALRTQSAAACREGMMYGDISSGFFESYWNSFLDSDGTNVTMTAWPKEVGGPPWAPVIHFWKAEIDGDIHGMTFTNWSLRIGDVTDYPCFSIRYQGIVEASTISDSWAGPIWTNKTTVILNVWEGEYGSDDLDDALVFYTEFINHGKLIPALRE